MDLTTPRLRLRMLHPSDAVWIARHIAVADVHRWLTSPPRPYGIQDAAAFIDQFQGVPGVRVIDLSGDPCGVINIASAQSFADDRPPLPELGYWLKRAVWGRGIVTEAACAMLAWHDCVGGGVLYSGYIDGNLASAAVLAKLGFVPQGTVSRRSEYFDADVTVHRLIRSVPAVT